MIQFELDLANELWTLHQQLISNTYQIAGYTYFTIYEPKEREIQALNYRDRVVQHSLCDNVLTPFFEKRLIYDNAACRKEKGTHFAMNRLTKFLQAHYRRYGSSDWVLKADIRKYFPSINHGVLLKRLEKGIPDPQVMDLLRMIIHSFQQEQDQGLPMGNQTSQLFALYYLDPLDRLIKEQLRIKHYTRYMDDCILVHPDKEVLQECLRQMTILVEDELKLSFNNKTQITPLASGVDYLGWHFYLTDTGKVIRKLRTQNKKKIKRRIKGLQVGFRKGRITAMDIKQSLMATKGHLQHGHTYHLRKKIAETRFHKGE
ncbi:group II intron reverse transcriptase domain-containing protein [Enterococcus sp. 669A]|uniref:Group II intron reverse transcriptase domain-containing protein n=1 Tax=Candidatus Enterococcus moelleringii TaxID=2815325 RepID=A0ABS3LBK0_9ENTE|nr:group II intron reverse transcriptase domain-containing protein [Enterococcus sp. 669A]